MTRPARINVWKISTCVLAAALGVVAVRSSISTAYADQPQPQPQMQAALAALDTAQNHLEKATADKGGFRVKAIQNIKDARENVKKGIEWDSTHKSPDEKK